KADKLSADSWVLERFAGSPAFSSSTQFSAVSLSAVVLLAIRVAMSLADGATDSLELVQMQNVVARIELELVSETLFTALHVHSHALQVFPRRSLDEPKIPSSQNREL